MIEKQLHILIVNINGLKFTKNVIGDLTRQTYPFKLTVVDQGSTEPLTKDFLDGLYRVPFLDVNVICNKSNIDLNKLWNNFYLTTTEPYLCFLNNDVRIARNFVESSVQIFEREEEVGAVVHTTNHPSYNEAIGKLEYVVLGENIVQGYDFTIRREVYTPIPDDLKVFGGDDWLFVKMYRELWRTAMCLNSPIIHYKAQSRVYYEGNRKEVLEALELHGIERLSYRTKYTKSQPTFDKIVEVNGFLKGAWYE